MFGLFINTTIIKTGQLLINYCKINMVRNIKQCIEMKRRRRIFISPIAKTILQYNELYFCVLICCCVNENVV